MPIGNYSFRIPMQAYYFFKEQLSNMMSVISFSTRNKCAILENRSTTTKIEYLALAVRGNPNTKSILKSIQAPQVKVKACKVHGV